MAIVNTLIARYPALIYHVNQGGLVNAAAPADRRS